MARLVLQVAAALPAAARPRAAEAAVVDEVARQRNLPAPCRKLRMVIPTLAVFGTSRTRRLRESKSLTRLRVVVAALEVAAAEDAAVAAVVRRMVLQ
jgi:hypothetical protein